MSATDTNNQMDLLREKAIWVRKETLKIHKIAPETRIASSLSAVEIFVVLYYGKILKFDAKISSGRGGIDSSSVKVMARSHFTLFLQIWGILIKMN